MMVKFTCQPDWAMGYPDIWSDVSPGLSVSGFWVRIAFEFVD